MVKDQITAEESSPLKTYIYNNRQFVEFNLPEWRDGLEWGAYLKELGYYDFPTMAFGAGGDYEPTVRIYHQRDRGEWPEYLCELSVSESIEYFCARDGLNLALLLNFFAPLLTLGCVQTVYQGLFDDETGHIDDDKIAALGGLLCDLSKKR